MPVEFLSDEQAEAYGTFAEEPTRPELERFFFLDDVDRDLIALRRTEHHRLGFALQMCTVRYVGLFLEDPLAVPWPVVEHLAVQLGIEDPSVVKRYTERRQTLYDHAWEIRDAYGYHPYEDAEWGRRFRTFPHGREACNIGLTPVVNPGYEALTRSRLVHVDQYYLRADTIAAANAALIAAQADIPIVRFWGDGLLASADGLRFQVPVRTINAAPSPKYFGFKRGITWLNAVNDQVAGIGQMVVPGTPRDSPHILDALLNLDGGVKPEMVATDNASYSDMVFGPFKILGYNFSPRFRDLDDQRFWRATMPGVETGSYGAVEDLARNRVNLNKVITHWPDMLKVAGSLVTNQVRAYDLPRMFGRDGRPTPLGAAFAEYGRIAKTEHLLRVVDPVDDTYRRQMNRQLTVQESRHKLARDVCHGKRGTIHQAYRVGMEDQLGALGLVLNAIVLWTTKYIDAAVAQLRAEGHEIREEDIARLSPLKHRNLNLLGRYSFTSSVPAAGALRPPRDPEAPELDEDDDGRED